MATARTPANDDSTRNETREGTIAATGANRLANRFRSFVQQEAAKTGADESDNWEVTATQLDKMLAAETVDDIMDADAAGTHQARDLVGLEFEALDLPLVYRPSSDEFKAPLEAYVQFQAVALIEYDDIQPGEQITISSGAPLIVGKLRTLQANGFLPMQLKIVHAGGKGVLKLIRAPKRATSSTTA